MLEPEPPPFQTEQNDEYDYDPEKFIRELYLLEFKLYEAVCELNNAYKGELDEIDEIQITELSAKKNRLANEMFRHLANAYKASNGEVCKLPQFNPNNTRYFMKLSLPCEPHLLWITVDDWMEDEAERQERKDQEIIDDALKQAQELFSKENPPG